MVDEEVDTVVHTTPMYQPPMVELAPVEAAGIWSSKREREQAIYMEYKRFKGTGVNAIKVLMERHSYRPTQKSTFTGMIKRARERAGDVK
jgi:hypothetical protein